MADFSKASGNSMKGNTVIIAEREGHCAKDENGKVKAVYVEAMVDNSSLKKADIQAGKGQANPNLYSKKTDYTDENGETKSGYDNSIRMSESQVETIKAAAGKDNTLETTDKNGNKVTYYRVKADLMPLMETVKGEDGKPAMGEDGKPQQKMVGTMPNTKTVESAEGKLTQNRLDKHFANTEAINDVRKAAAAAKSANLSATADKAEVKETAAPAKELGD